MVVNTVHINSYVKSTSITKPTPGDIFEFNESAPSDPRNSSGVKANNRPEPARPEINK